MIIDLFTMGVITTLAAEFAIFFLGAIIIAVVKTVREKRKDVATSTDLIPGEHL